MCLKIVGPDSVGCRSYFMRRYCTSHNDIEVIGLLAPRQKCTYDLCCALASSQMFLVHKLIGVALGYAVLLPLWCYPIPTNKMIAGRWRSRQLLFVVYEDWIGQWHQKVTWRANVTTGNTILIALSRSHSELTVCVREMSDFLRVGSNLRWLRKIGDIMSCTFWWQNSILYWSVGHAIIFH